MSAQGPQRTDSPTNGDHSSAVTAPPTLAPTGVVATPPVAVPGYEIQGELGRGGMGIVYKARQMDLNRVVALKMVISGDHAGEEDRRRFREEACAVACLQHPNIVQIYEVDEVGGRPFFSMEYCAGGCLAGALDGTPWRGDRAAVLVETLARAAHAAHKAGIVHRDLKPANVLLTGDGVPKLTDFGVAKKLDGSGSKTQTGAVVGTPSYMAPEQAGSKGGPVGPGADVYALGAILYELLTGRPPFKAATPLETMIQAVAEEPLPPRRLQPGVPRDLNTVCLKCLQKDPRRRYASAAALADDLQRFLVGEPVLARPTPFWEVGVKWARRHPSKTTLLGVCLLSAVVAWVSWYLVDRHEKSQAFESLVHALGTADAASVPRVIEELGRLRGYSGSGLRVRAHDRNGDPHLRLRATLALEDLDDEDIEYLSWRLLDCPLSELGLVCDHLKPFAGRIGDGLFEVLRDASQADGARFRAGLALAGYDPDAEGWTAREVEFVVGQLLDSGRDDQKDLRDRLRPLGNRLFPPLEEALRADGGRTTARRLAAADALADFAGDDVSRLIGYACEANADQYEVFRRTLLAKPDQPAVRAAVLAFAKELAERPPAADLGAAGRVRHGKRRAGAVLTLLHLGERGTALEALHDHEAATQFVHRLRERRVSQEALRDCLAEAADADVRCTLLLALGEFKAEEIPPVARGELEERLLGWLREDPRSDIHGAAAWLLRTWGRGGEVDVVDRTPVAYDRSGRRQWFVERVGEDCFTFVVFPAGRFMMGASAGDPDREATEPLHAVQITRPFAVCDREMTAAAFQRFLAATELPTPGALRATAAAGAPATRMTWPEAVLYCRWLTKQAGMDETQQCYGDDGPWAEARKHLLVTADFRPERTGFRLPTEAEWECACRGGAVSAYGFGDDPQMLPFYGRHLQHGPAAVGLLRPNRRGLFDMHGNVWEWCQDWHHEQPREEVDPVGPATGTGRVLRGGGWDRAPWHCRSAYRHAPTPDYRGSYMGFRLARTLPAGS